MKKVLVDTSVLVEFLRIKEKTVYREVLSKGWRPVVSFITPAELWAGRSAWEDKGKTKALEKLLSAIEIVFPQASTLKLSGKLRAHYQISLLDAFIAACAIEEKLPLFTLNLRDFKKIKGVNLFKI